MARLDRARPAALTLEGSSQALAERALRPDHARKRPTWAELLKRTFEIDVLTCPWCGEKRKLIALLTDGKVVRAIVEHLGLPTAAPVLAPAGIGRSKRAPPGYLRPVRCLGQPPREAWQAVEWLGPSVGGC